MENKELPLPKNNADVLILARSDDGYDKQYHIGYYECTNEIWKLKVAETYIIWPSYFEILNWMPIPDIMRVQEERLKSMVSVGLVNDPIDKNCKVIFADELCLTEEEKSILKKTHSTSAGLFIVEPNKEYFQKGYCSECDNNVPLVDTFRGSVCCFCDKPIGKKSEPMREEELKDNSKICPSCDKSYDLNELGATTDFCCEICYYDSL